MESLHLEELSATTALQANTLELVPGQEAFVTPVTYEQSEATLNLAKTWSRVILSGDEVVGFIRAHFDDSHEQPELQSCIWRVSVAASAQGKGVGRFAIDAAREEATALGHSVLTAVWSRDEQGPGDFFHKLGFHDSGITDFGDQIGTLTL
jgi:diamine N-acetyltransferase